MGMVRLQIWLIQVMKKYFLRATCYSCRVDGNGHLYTFVQF